MVPFGTKHEICIDTHAAMIGGAYYHTFRITSTRRCQWYQSRFILLIIVLVRMKHLFVQARKGETPFRLFAQARKGETPFRPCS